MEGDLQRTVGHNLRAHRESRGLSQEAFADLVGVHRTYMGGLERGERNLTLRSLERIAGSIGVEPRTLLEVSADTRTPSASVASRGKGAAKDRRVAPPRTRRRARG